MFFRSFLPGTVIHNKPVKHLPPIIVLKENQVMLEMSSKDFSFVGEQHVGHLYHLFEKLHVKPNLTQNGAISFVCVLDDRAEKIEKLALEASAFLMCRYTKDYHCSLSVIIIKKYLRSLQKKNPSFSASKHLKRSRYYLQK